ncbi:DNA cytosine methyltransferase [Coprococcus comes]|jgi:DNA (cytosine-5)-methyltransferase 1|uniref:DNA cytosine methyltransferase n=1 Tax=Coprococcus comes TaxID=410072 RepID=UPI00156F100A|nr:DNA cytosine methyltransferase [Coprococcus comes]NSD32207.1 DNA (cytosine-5-)-methyltransferase [Coprococcus comes]NSF08586.1 DNA (cytosine-5-)-methyltransferase [Coprococcus comes]
MKQEITMGSLFSGSGGFELAGSIFGIRPIWASEIEPFPILVTTKNFPEMKHLGDINKLNGADLEPVTIIAGGSPCQDMSIAGKREGLDGSRSNLFREQIRIIKEMRESDRAAGRTGTQIRPRYMVWENVPGAFSSNKGKDFQAVLQEIVSITDEESNVPLPPKGKWQTAGCIMGDHFSIAWRVLDAQYWGVPQRRKRIYLVADFGGNTAPKILFEREGLSGNFAESREAWQRTAGDIKTGTHKTGTDDVECYDISDRRRVADKSEVSPTLTTKMGTGGNNVPIVLENHPQDSRVTIAEDGNVPTLTSRMGTGGGNVPMIMNEVRAVDQRNLSLGNDKSETLHGSGHGSSVGTIIEPMALHITQDPTVFEGKTPCLTQGNPKTGQATVGVAIPIADKATRYKGGGSTRNNDGSANGLGIGEPGAPANTLTAADRHGVACFAQQAIGEYEESEKASCLKRRDYKDSTDLILWEYIIRRLTPLECCRLQGFPDNWAEELGIPEPTQEDIDHWREVFRTQIEAMGESKKEKTDNQICKWLKDPESDSAKYKMWGNGIALPCAMFVMEGISMILSEEDADEQK